MHGHLHGQAYRAFPVRLHEGIVRRLESGEHVRDDRLRILASGVVRGDNRDISTQLQLAPHLRTLASVAVASAAEDTDDPTFREAAGGGEHVTHGIRSMRVINHHSELLAPVDSLHPAGNAREGRNRLQHVLEIQAKSHPDAHGRQGVRHVECPHKLRTHLSHQGTRRPSHE